MSYILPQQLLNWPDKFLALCVWQDALWRLGFWHVFEVQSQQFCSKLVVSNAQKTAYFLVCIIPSMYTGIIIKLSSNLKIVINNFWQSFTKYHLFRVFPFLPLIFPPDLNKKHFPLSFCLVARRRECTKKKYRKLRIFLIYLFQTFFWHLFCTVNRNIYILYTSNHIITFDFY